MRNAIVVGVFASLFFTLIFHGLDASASTTWYNSTPIVKYSEPINYVPTSVCKKTMLPRKIYGEADRKETCIDETGPLKFGFYMAYSGYQSVVGFAGSDMLYKLDGLDCDYSCVYSPQYDTLIMRTYLINGYVKSMVVINNFSARIQVNYNFTNNVSLTVSSLEPSYVFQSDTGYQYPVNGLGLSNNGRYLGIEARQRGFLVMDLATMTMKRISNFGLSYGYGFDPGVEIAMTNDGNTMLITGFNAGLMVYDGLLSCGDEPTTPRMDSIMPLGVNECPRYDLPINFTPNFYYATDPRFINSGKGVSFYTGSYMGEYRQVYLTLDSQSSQIKLLSLGDSYTSGEGENDNSQYQPYTDTEHEKCHTSYRSYPYLMASMTGFSSSVHNVACSGAITDDILGISKSGVYWGQKERIKNLIDQTDIVAVDELKRDALLDFVPGRIAQMDFVSEYKPEVVTIGIGGNDIGLVGKLKACMMGDTCQYADDPDERAKVASQIKSLFYTLEKVYLKVIKESPKSRVYAVGYPQIISLSGSCDSLTGNFFDLSERRFMRETITYMNQVIQAAASSAGAIYIDIENTYGNSTLCGTNQTSVMNGLVWGNDMVGILGNESFHPNPQGHSLTAQSIIGQYPNILTNSYCFNGASSCPITTGPPSPSSYWTDGASQVSLDVIVKQIYDFVLPESSREYARNVLADIKSFMGGSNVTIGVHSDYTELGQFTATSDGSLDVSVNLPEGLGYGYHTLVLRGTAFSGEPIEYQQVIFLEGPEEQVTEPEPEAEPTSSSSTSTTPKLTSSSINKKTIASTQGPAVLGVSTKKVNGEDKLAETTPPSNTFWLAMLGLGALGSGVVSAGLYIRHSKITTKSR